MKILILTLNLMVATVLSALSQTTEQAPFGGKLIDKPTTVTIERPDGSRITSFNNNGSLYLTRKAVNADNALPVPNYVKITKPNVSTYINEKGQEYVTFDGKNWSRKPINLPDGQHGSTTNAVTATESPIFSFNKFPVMPIADLFHMEFTLKADAEINFLITNATGEIITSDVKKLSSGSKNYDFNFKNFANGVYYLQLTINGVKLSAKMISKVD